MFNSLKSLKIVQSFLTLEGNSRVSVLFEPLWGIPYIFYNFYLSLYLKEMGVTDRQFGILIAAGFISGAVFSLFGGIITDLLGRKKTTLIFDFLSWPFAIFIFLISQSFLMFVAATVVNNIVRIVSVSWNMMVVEDADSRQRIAAYNILNIINISLGIITPLAGIIVASSGVVFAERCFMIFAIVSMSTMIISRNHFYRETRMGQQILDEHKGSRFRDIARKGLFRGAFRVLGKNPGAALIIAVNILFNLTLPLGAFNSMYFALFMTGQVGIGKASVSILGGIYSGVILLVFLAVTPRIGKKGGTAGMLSGLVIQGASLVMIALIPKGVLAAACLCVALYGLGYGIFKPFLDSLTADVSEGRERAGLYSLVNTAISIFSALIGYASGYIYAFDPRWIFFSTAVILGICAIGMVCFIWINGKMGQPREIKAIGKAG